MPKVLIADELSPRAGETFSNRGIDIGVRTGLSEPELSATLKDCDGLVVCSAIKATKAALKNADALKVIGRAGVGIDNIDLEAATSAGVVVMNAPSGNATTTAEHALARQIPEQMQVSYLTPARCAFWRGLAIHD